MFQLLSSFTSTRPTVRKNGSINQGITNNKSHFLVILISALLAIIIELKLYRSYFRYLSFLDNICILKEDMLSLVSMIFVFLSWLWVRTILKYTRKALGTTIEIVWTISTCGFLFCEWSGLLTIAECAGFEDAGTSSPPSQSSFTPSEKEFLNGIFETEAGEPAVQQEPVGQQGAAPLPPEEISLEEFWKVVDAATNPAEAPQLAEPTTQTQGERTVSGYGQGEGAPGQPTRVMGSEELSLSSLREKIEKVLRSAGTGNRKPRSYFMKRIEDTLRLETASPQKLQKIDQVLGELSTNRDPSVNSGKKIADELTVRVYDWERENELYHRPLPSSVSSISVEDRQEVFRIEGSQ